MKFRSPTVSVVLALALFVTGCGGAKKTSMPNASTTASTTHTSATAGNGSTTSTTEASALHDTATDKVSAQKLVLVASDLPSGWQDGQPQTEDSIQTQGDTKLNACLGEPPVSTLYETKVQGDDFTQGQNSISSEVDVYNTAAAATQDQQLSTNPTYFSCIAGVLDQTFAAEAASQGQTGITAHNTISVLNGVTTAANQTAVRLTRAVQSATGGHTTLYADIVGYVKDRFGVSVNIQSAGTPPPLSVDKQLLATLVKHGAGTST